MFSLTYGVELATKSGDDGLIRSFRQTKHNGQAQEVQYYLE